MTIPAPLVSTSAASLLFLAGLGWVIFRTQKLDEFEGDGIGPATVYCILVFMTIFGVTMSYFSGSIAIGIEALAAQSTAWLKYLEWTVSSSLMISALLLLTRDRNLVLEGLAAQATVLICGYSASVLSGTAKLMMYSVMAVIIAIVVNVVWFKGRESASQFSSWVSEFYNQLAVLITGMWVIYIFFWPMSADGFQVVGFRTSKFLWTSFDLLAKLSFAYLVTTRLQKIEKHLQ